MAARCCPAWGIIHQHDVVPLTLARPELVSVIARPKLKPRLSHKRKVPPKLVVPTFAYPLELKVVLVKAAVVNVLPVRNAGHSRIEVSVPAVNAPSEPTSTNTIQPVAQLVEAAHVAGPEREHTVTVTPRFTASLRA